MEDPDISAHEVLEAMQLLMHSMRACHVRNRYYFLYKQHGTKEKMGISASKQC